MASTRAPERRAALESRESGVALFMVIAAISVLSILVTEFVYVAQVNQKIAFDGLDGVKAHYLAKSGLKLSLLRLKAYQNIKALAKNLGGGAPGGQSVVPKAIIEKIWSFPFMYPIPTNLPGLGPTEKERIDAFQKASGLDGSFSAIIESESSKYNLNLILAPFAPPAPSPSPGPSPSAPPVANNPGAPPPAPSPVASFNPDDARKSLADYIGALMQNKIDNDEAFASEYRDFKLDDLMDAIVGWADLRYERRNQGAKEVLSPKRAPFYTVAELRMIPGMDDTLYDVIAPQLTASTTPGINVNTMKENTLRAILSPLQVQDDEVKNFFKDRDNEEEDNQFKTADDFFKYLQGHFTAFRNSDAEVQKYKDGLAKRNIRIVTDETLFKITVRATINQTSRLIEAWVTLTDAKKDAPKTGVQPIPGQQWTTIPTGSGPGADPNAPAADAGLRITFMRIL